jgi:hypothetical protein
VPAAVEEPTVNVSVEVPEPGARIGVGLNAAVVPAGNPDAVSATAELKPPETVVVIVLVPAPPAVPRFTEIAEGEAEIAKAGGGVTLRITLDVWVSPPPVPVTTIVCVPAATVEATAMVMVDVPEPGAAIVVGLKVTVTPAGTKRAESATAELKPPETAVLTVHVPVLPATTETDVGDADTVNAAALTVSEMDVVCVTPPPVPVTVMG